MISTAFNIIIYRFKMNPFYVFLSLFLSISVSYAQKIPHDTINRSDSLGRKQGYWIKKEKDGTLKYEGRFVNDKPTGKFIYYYPDKKIKAQTDFGSTGYSRAITYHTNGKVLSVGTYYNTLKDSVWKYFNEFGKQVAEESYDKGVKNGAWKIFYSSNGKICEEFNWENGQKRGAWMKFFEDGNTKVKGTYKDGHLDGLFQSFYQNGKVELSGTYKQSLKDGIWISFAENGESNYKETYKAGNLKKKEIYFKLEGKVKAVDLISIAMAYYYQGKVKIMLKNKDLIPVDEAIERIEFLLGPEKFIRINKNAVVCYEVIKGLKVYNEQFLKLVTQPESEIELIADEGSSEFLITRYKILK